MTPEVKQSKIKTLTFERNFLVFVCLLLLLSLSFLSIFVASSSTRTILVPVNLNKRVWLESSASSDSYLEEWACLLSQLLLSKNFENYDEKARLLLPFVEPDFLEELLKSLDDEAKQLIKNRVAYTFEIQNAEVHNQTVVLKGDQTCKVDGSIVSKQKKIYRMSFSIKNGQPFLTSLEGLEDV